MDLKFFSQMQAQGLEAICHHVDVAISACLRKDLNRMSPERFWQSCRVKGWSQASSSCTLAQA